MCKFGIVYSWDYKDKCAEKELIERVKYAAKELNIECILANIFGKVLDEEYNPTELLLDEVIGLEFVLHTHFISSKYQDYFSIYPLWNPPAFLFHWPEYNYLIDNLRVHDDYFTSHGFLAESHINCVNLESKKNLNTFLPFLPTSTEDTIYKPKILEIEEFKIFYAGSGWEKTAGEPTRHETIFKGLDELGIFELYGPQKIGNYAPWEGYKSYKGEIAFDGKTIFKKINECGIALAISSLEHNKSGILTNRIYEAIISGAVVITDNSEIVKELFGDNVLTVDNFGNQKETLKQIKEKIEWVKNNKEQVHKMVENLQKLFLERLSLEKQIKHIFDNIQQRKNEIALNYYTKENQDIVDVIIKWTSPNLVGIEKIIKNIKKQIFKNFNIIFVCDVMLAEAVKKIFTDESLEAKIVDLTIYNHSLNKKRLVTTGEMIQKSLSYLKGKYLTFMNKDDIWFSDHITILKRFLDDDKNLNLAYSGFATKVIENDKTNFYHRDFYKKYSFNDLKIFSTRFSEGSMLLRASAYLDKMNVLRLIDNLEFHYFMVYVLEEGRYKFSDKLTFIKEYYSNKINYSETFILPIDKQKLFINSIIKPEQMVEIEVINEEFINHNIKMYILQHIKNPLILIKKIIRNIFK